MTAADPRTRDFCPTCGRRIESLLFVQESTLNAAEIRVQPCMHLVEMVSDHPEDDRPGSILNGARGYTLRSLEPSMAKVIEP